MLNTKNMPFQLALDAIRDAKAQLDSVDPTLHLAEIAPCSVEDLQRLQRGVRAALAQMRDMESLYTGEADLKVSVSEISRTIKTRSCTLCIVLADFSCCEVTPHSSVACEKVLQGNIVYTDVYSRATLANIRLFCKKVYPAILIIVWVESILLKLVTSLHKLK
jgi:hypothetical protein